MAWLARAVLRRPAFFLYPQLALALLCVLYTVKFLDFDTRRDNLVGSNKKYHQNFLRFKKEFPTQDDLVVVVESESSEKNRQFVERLGARLVEVSLPHSRYGIAAYYLIAPAEASSNLARYDGVKYGFRAEGKNLMETYLNTRTQGFGAEVRRRIMLGTYTLSAGYYDAYYKKGSQVRALIRRDFDSAFKECALIACPVSPTPAFRLGEKLADPLTMYLSDIFTISANLAGIPGISVPCGCSSQGLPIGLQLLGPAFGEADILQAAYAFEQATDWHRRKPSF